MQAQATTIIACDLFTVESIKLKTMHVLFFIDLHSRRVLLGGVTDHTANMAWCTQIARNLSEARESRPIAIEYLVHDRDDRFGSMFDEVFKAEGIKILRTPWRAPKANAYAERLIRTVRAECTDRILFLGPRHLESVLTLYLKHYNNERPHRGLEFRPPNGWPPTTAKPSSVIKRRDHLGGLIHEYYCKAT